MIMQPWVEGRSNEGKVFAAIYPHSDDYTFEACGLIIKLLSEGYKGFFVRLTDDCMDSHDMTYGKTAMALEQEVHALARHLGIEKVYDFNYSNHYMDHSQLPEIRHRLITLFRFLRVDTVITFDPYGHYEENPDHQITGMAVEQACMTAGHRLDLPETIDMGLLPHFVRERYYSARGPQEANCLIDVASVMDKIKQAVWLHETPLKRMWHIYLETHGEGKNSKMDYETFVKTFFVERQQEPCQGLTQYEKFRYVGLEPFARYTAPQWP